MLADAEPRWGVLPEGWRRSLNGAEQSTLRNVRTVLSMRRPTSSLDTGRGKKQKIATSQ